MGAMNNQQEPDFTLTEKETKIILSSVKDLNIEFKGINKHHKAERLMSKFMIFEYIMNADLTIDDNNINFFISTDINLKEKLNIDKKFKQSAIERIIQQTKIIKN